MANSVLCIFLLALLNFSITLSISPEKILTAIDSNGKTHTDIGTVSPGQWIAITCKHTDSIIWSRSGFGVGSQSERLVSSDTIQIKDNELKINKINFNDSGVYYCEQNAIAYRFFLHVLAITKTTDGIVPTTTTLVESNGISYNSTKINERMSANVSCFCESGNNNTQINIIWRGGQYEKWSDLYTIITSRTYAGVNSTLILKKATNNPKLYGEYTCSCNAVSNTKIESKVFMKVPPIFADHDSSIRRNEGEDFELHCNVWAYPPIIPDSIKWRFQNTNLPLREGMTVSHNSSEAGFTKLMLTKVTKADRGIYGCYAENEISSNVAVTMVRVKSRYAALWPFIGVLIQLAILIAIIAVYEWKKSQKSKEERSKCNFDSKNDPDALVTERGHEPESVRQRLVKT